MPADLKPADYGINVLKTASQSKAFLSSLVSVEYFVSAFRKATETPMCIFSGLLERQCSLLVYYMAMTHPDHLG